jgi:hypothetical protein
MLQDDCKTKGSTTKVDDLSVEFLSSDEENWVWVKFLHFAPKLTIV